MPGTISAVALELLAACAGGAALSASSFLPTGNRRPAEGPDEIRRPLPFPKSRIHSLGGGEFPVSVWLRAWGSGMQLTSFPDRRTTCRTRHRQYLFRGEFFGLHPHIMPRSWPWKCSILLILNVLGTRQYHFECSPVCPTCEQNWTSS